MTADKNNKEYGFVIEIGAQEAEEVRIGDPKVADATGVAMKLLNTVRKLPERVVKAEQAIDYSKSNVEKLRALVQPWMAQRSCRRQRNVTARSSTSSSRRRRIKHRDLPLVVNKDGQRFASSRRTDFIRESPAEDWITDQVEKNRRESIPSDREPDERAGNSIGIRRVILLAAPVEIDGDMKNFAVSIRETVNGTFHYDFDAGQRGEGGRWGPV